MKLKKYLNSQTYEVIDKILSNKDIEDKLKEISIKIKNNVSLIKDDIVYLLNLSGNNKDALFDLANAIRKDRMGEIVFVKGIIEFSNYCKQNCTYCGIRAESKIKRYRMAIDEIVETAKKYANYGIDTIILQSGEDPYYTTDKIAQIIKRIRRETQKPISLSIGEREIKELSIFKKAGASKYLLKQESINPRIFKNVHGEGYDRRINLIRELVSLNYITGGGNIIGLPNQTVEDIADDIIFMKKTGVKMAGIGPFIPTKGTPLEKSPVGSADLTLKAYACTRLCIPKILLPSTTALGTIDPKLQYKGLEVGCNVIMVNCTPEKYRKDYNIYDNKRRVEFYDTVKDLIKLGKKVSPLIFKTIERNGLYEDTRIL